MGYGGPERGVRSLSPWCRVWRGSGVHCKRSQQELLSASSPDSNWSCESPGGPCCAQRAAAAGGSVLSAVQLRNLQPRQNSRVSPRTGTAASYSQAAEDRSLYNIQSSERKGFVFILIALYKVRHFLHKATNIVTSFFAMFSIDMLYLNYAPEYKM